jgi:sialidase-1
MRFILYTVLGTLLLSCTAEQLFNEKPLWISGKDGYDTYRIPALTVTENGTILAFCEGRKSGRGDTGDIDLLLKRSTDTGRSWSAQQIIWNDQNNTCGNPSPVIDRKTGTVWLLMTWNRGDDHEREIIDLKSNDTRRIFVTHSDDDGISWSPPEEITAAVKTADWTWYATGPGAGIQLTRGEYAGRLVIPCDHIEAGTKYYYSHVIFSDDGGKNWLLGGSTPYHQVNECQVVELSDGRLLLNMRNYDRSKNYRQTAVSADGGLTWTDQKFDRSLIEPVCQAALRRYAWPEMQSKGILLFANPADKAQRIKMTIRISYDEGISWPVVKLLNEHPSAYSDLAVLKNKQIACLYETGENSAYETITFARFDLSWIFSD